MKISNTNLAGFQLMNEISAIAANNFIANLDYLFYVCGSVLVFSWVGCNSIINCIAFKDRLVSPAIVLVRHLFYKQNILICNKC